MLNRKCFDHLSNSHNQFFQEVYGDESEEFEFNLSNPWFLFILALEDCKVTSNLIPLKSLIQGAACQALRKMDVAVQVRKLRNIFFSIRASQRKGQGPVMFSVLGSSSSPGWVSCVGLLGKTLNSLSASFHPAV